MPDTPTVAFLGTGTMGAPMAANIAEAGFPTRVWNRNRERAEAVGHATEVFGKPDEAVAGADVVVTMLFDADSVAEVMGDGGALGAMGRDAVWIQTSTVGPDGCDRLARMAAERGVSFVDAPVLGTKAPAEQKKLTVLASGPDDVRDRVQPVLDAVGTTPRWIGEAGAGSRLKVVVNAWLLALTDSTATALRLAERLGVEGTTFLETIKGGPVDAAYAQLKGSAMLDGTWDPSFRLEGARKDAGLALDAAGEHGLALLRTVAADMDRAIDAGHGGEDLAAIWFGTGS